MIHRREGLNMSDVTPPADGPAKEQLKAAMKAFKKRLKLTRLDQESHLSRRPTTTGLPSDIVAITPPDQFPHAVWDELVRQGKLKTNKYGTYEMVAE
jgi:hypothetical protein